MDSLQIIEDELKKLKYHIRLISETIDPTLYPIQSLVLEMNWNEEDLDKAHDIFEKYHNKIDAEEAINWSSFEHELKDTFQVGYQTVKSIVLAFFRNDQWVQVCKGYAAEHDVMEFKEINEF